MAPESKEKTQNIADKGNSRRGLNLKPGDEIAEEGGRQEPQRLRLVHQGNCKADLEEDGRREKRKCLTKGST